jgi:hypothetical protein
VKANMLRPLRRSRHDENDRSGHFAGRAAD